MSNDKWEMIEPVYIKGQLIPGQGHLVTNFFVPVVSCNIGVLQISPYASTSPRWCAALSNPFNFRSQDNDNSFCVFLPDTGQIRLRTHSKGTTLARFVAFPGVFLFLLLFSARRFRSGTCNSGCYNSEVEIRGARRRENNPGAHSGRLRSRQSTLSCALYDGRRRSYWPHRRHGRVSVKKRTDV